MSTLEEAIRDDLRRLPEGLRLHVERAADEAERLAALHGVDAAKVRVAVLGHDLVRALPPDDLLSLAEKIGLSPNDAERASPVLLHGAIAARLLAERFAVDDPDVLAAVRCHTTGRAGMTAVEKVVFLADKTEPDELAHYPEWREVQELAQRDLNAAMLKALDLYLERARREGWTLHPDVLAARDDLLSHQKTHP
ncbi:MAG: bis(5'-nucleosyl)-tetraphosphatase (symmetrical) YqeK [Dehalococcoidia bacterium]